MPFKIARAAAAPALALAALAATPALAQDQSSGGQSQGQAQAAQQDFSDEQLKAFAMAMLDVRDIVQEAEPKLAAAEGAEAKNEIRKSATEEMMQAVKDSGLSVDAYNAIAQTAGQDPELAKKISGYVTEAEGE
jgi:hypothetical protein